MSQEADELDFQEQNISSFAGPDNGTTAQFSLDANDADQDELKQKIDPVDESQAAKKKAISSQDALNYFQKNFGFLIDPAQRPQCGAHPIASFFHIFFKVCAIFSYLFLGLFVKNFVFIFVVCIVFLACDFWTVKNITGRLLVGLRWWNEVTEDGKNIWKFESNLDRSKVHTVDFYIFWCALLLDPAIWIIFGAASIFMTHFSSLAIIIVALIMDASNIYGYFKCQKDLSFKKTISRGLGRFILSQGLGENRFGTFLSRRLGW